MTSAAAQVTPYLPTGRQLRESRVPASAQSQLEELSLRILRKLLVPLLLPWRARRARRRLLEATRRAYAEGQVHQAAERALRYTSALGVAMPTLNGGSDSDGATSPGAVSTGQTSRRGSRPPRAVPLAASSEVPTSAAAAAATSGGPLTESEAPPDVAEERGEEAVIAVAENDRPVPELCAESIFTMAAVSAAMRSSPASPAGGASPTLTASQQRAVELAVGGIVNMLNDPGTRLRVHMQQEWLQASREPAHEVLVLLAGALLRRCPAMVVAANATTPASPTGEAEQSTPAAGGSHSSLASSLQGSWRPSSAAVVGVALGGSRASGGRPASTRRGSQLLNAHGQPITGLDGSVYRGATGEEGGRSDVLKAPLVLGELAVLGGFPYGEDLVVESERCVLMAISRDAYCRLVAASLPAKVQRRLMVAALAQRERLLPWFAPMTPGRLRLCPLLSTLGDAELAHVQDHLVPRVFAAGMVCSENMDPQHIFVIRRGLVRVEREGFANVERGAATSPKNRTLLVEGHTFGESACIYRESLGDTYYALTHVDAYLVPFRVLIQLMKQQPGVQSTIYACARAMSVMRERDFDGVLRFNPGQEPVLGLQGVTTRRSSILPAASRRASRRTSVMSGNPLGFAASGSVIASRTNSIIGGDLGPMLGSEGYTVSGRGPQAHGPTAGSRRVTIFEEEGTTIAAGNDGLVGGRVSTDLLAAMRDIPLVKLVGTAEAIDDVSRLWRCTRYEKGDVIARRGDECNRLLCFFEGRAVVVLDENALRREMAPTPFGAADLSVVAAANAALVGSPNGPTTGTGQPCLQTIPPGHMIGYTCVLRHRWVRSVLAADNVVEVWEIPRAQLVAVLRKHGLERRMWTATQQVLQPFLPQRERFHALDYQPLARPMPSSLWAEQPITNVHPTRTSESAALFPVWREGDFPLDRQAADG